MKTENEVSVPNFRLFFGKYKGKLLSQTPKDYQGWLVTSDFFKNLKIKYPVQNRYRDGNGNYFYQTEYLLIKTTNTLVSNK